MSTQNASIGTVETFTTVREAKEFVISRIVTESQLEGVPLSDVERKIMYFSETGWTLPDIDAVNDVFDRDYDQTEYEHKIGKLARSFLAKARKDNPDEFEAWKNAVHTIRKEDHYLLVLIDAVAGSSDTPGARFLKLFAIAFAIACLIFAIGYLFLRYLRY